MNQNINTGLRKYKDIFLIVIGTVIAVLGMKLFLIPNKIATGGISGAATILHYVLGWPVGTVVLIVNAVLFLLAFKDQGKDFGFKSVFATALFAVLLDVMDFPSVTNDAFLACVYGGVVHGIGLGIVFRGNATTGGTDLIAKMVHKRFRFIGMSWIMFVLDFIVVVAAGIAFKPELALYALAALYLSTKVIAFILEGMNYARAFFIISGESKAIASRVMTEMGRGVTALRGKGGYSESERDVLLCVLEGRNETSILNRIVKEEDPKAFVIISDVREVAGEGFDEEKYKL